MIAAVVVAVLLVVAVLTGTATTYDAELDPQNPGPDGAQAVARVLAAHGVEVTVVRRSAELADARVDAGTTVVVTSSDELGDSTARQLRRRLDSAGAVVLPAPGGTLARAMGLPLESADVRGETTVAARCDDPLLTGLRVEVPASEGLAPAPGATSCFRGSGPGAYVLRLDRRLTTYVVAAAALLTDDRVDRSDNAAVALRLLGQHPRLLWYVPDARDVRVGDSGSLAAQLPSGLVPALWLGAAALLATMCWRGRRLGSLVVEPLPVVVKAIESTQGRGRLYHQVRDRTHAAAVLRDATTRRLATRLGLAPGTDAATVATACAQVDRAADPGAVLDLLARRPVPDDRALTRLATDLAMLEKELSHP